MLLLPARGSDDGAVQMLCGHGPVIGGIAIGVDGAVGRSDPVAAPDDVVKMAVAGSHPDGAEADVVDSCFPQ